MIRNKEAREKRLALYEKQCKQLEEACNRFFLFEDDIIKMI